MFPTGKGAYVTLNPQKGDTVSPTPPAASETQHVVQKMRQAALLKMSGEDEENLDSFDP